MTAEATRSARAPRRRTFESLSSRDYRLFFFGQLISVCGTWMQTVAQSFLVLQLTGSGTQLGLTTAVRFVPILVFAPAGGVAADRLDKRRIMYVTQTLSGVLALAFGLLVGTHSIQMWMVYLLALALGFVNVFDNPARQALIPELVPRELVRNAVTLNSVTMNMARIFGASLGGAIASLLGLALCFDLNAVSFAAVVGSLVLMSGQRISGGTGGRQRGQIREGLAYVRGQPELLIPLIMIAVIGALAWEFQISLPLMARSAFHGGPATYGLMSATMGIGAVTGGLIAASRPLASPRGLAIAAIGWGVAITIAALAPSLPVEFVALAFVGYGSISFNTLAKSTLQLSADEAKRGLVMSLWAVAWLGSTPVGGPLVGWVGQELGARWSLLIGGVPTVVVGLVTLPFLARLHQRRLAGTIAEAQTDPTAGAGQSAGGAAATGTSGAMRP